MEAMLPDSMALTWIIISGKHATSCIHTVSACLDEVERLLLCDDVAANHVDVRVVLLDVRDHVMLERAVALR